MKTGNRQQAPGTSKKKCFVFALCALLFAFCFSAEAQQPKKIPRIGYKSVSGDPTTPRRYVEAFQQGLRELGYFEGQNIVIEYRASKVIEQNFSLCAFPRQQSSL